MFCSKCGTELIEGAAFCQKCGVKVNNEENAQDRLDVASDSDAPQIIHHQLDTSTANDETTVDKLDVTLADVGPNKIKVIKMVRDWTGLGLKESTDLIDKVPVLLKKDVTEVEAESIKAAFMREGAAVAFKDQKGNDVDIIPHCRSCGVVVDGSSEICKSCGNVLFMAPPHGEAGPKPTLSSSLKEKPSPNVQQRSNTIPSYMKKRNKDSQSAMVVAVIACGIGGTVIALLIFVSIFIGIVSSFGQGSSSDHSQSREASVVTSTANLDRALYGRWRASDGTVIELSNDGIAQTSLNLSPWWTRGSLTELTWEATDGQLSLIATYDVQYTYIYTPENPDYEWIAPYDTIVFRGLYGGSEKFYRLNGTEGDSIFGKWVDAADGNNPNTTPFYVFNEDGTGSFNRGGVPCIWQADDENFYMTYALISSFDYYVQGDSLQIFFSDGSLLFTRVGN